MHEPPPLPSPAEVARALGAQRWTFAKTMPDNPHYWTTIKTWTGDLPLSEVRRFIRTAGYKERFGRTDYLCFNANGWKYWTMGLPILINRCRIRKPSPYDAIADRYDALWGNEAAHLENLAVLDRLAYKGGVVLDIGCGSGLFLDYVRPDGYLGIDPSLKMLDVLCEKHPQWAEAVIHADFESFYPERCFDLAIGLFAAPSYVAPEAWARLPDCIAKGGRWFLMFYKPGYEPATHRATGLVAPWHPHTACPLPGTWTEFGNYMILEGAP